MDQKPEVIRQQMEDTRTSLTDKLEALERKVTGTVQGSATAVEGAVDSVKDAVSETVDSVKEVFDISHQVERHPWKMMAGSVAVGYLAGMLMPGAYAEQKRRKGYGLPAGSFPILHGGAFPFESPPISASASAVPASPGILDEWHEKFGEEIGTLQSVAIGTTLGIIRDMVTPAVPPEIRPQIKEVIDGITTKLGGRPYRGPVLPEKNENARSTVHEYGREDFASDTNGRI
jgi:hypothetical protein